MYTQKLRNSISKNILQTTIIWSITFFLLSLSTGLKGQNSPSVYTGLRDGFIVPPKPAMPKIYWWWLNGDVDTTRLKEELHQMKEKGIGGVDIFEIGLYPGDNEGGLIKSGPPFMGPDFLSSLKVALDKAKELDMDVGMSVASSWNAGGSWVKPEHAAKTLYSSAITLSPASEETTSIAFPEIPEKDPRGRTRLIRFDQKKRPVYYEEVAVLAIPKGKNADLDTADVVNLSAFFDQTNSTLSWKPSEGEWEVYRYISANSGEQLFLPSPSSVGPILDHYHQDATTAHLQFIIDRLKPLVGNSFENSALKYLYLASYEATDFAWTNALPEKFRELNGYELTKFIPAVFSEKNFRKDLIEPFRQDLRYAFSEMMIDHHYRKAKEICNENGLKVISEAGGPGVYKIPVETLKALGALDTPRGEFWYKTQRLDKDGVDIMWLVKEIAAASHIYKMKMVEEEAFTSMKNWQENPLELKLLADRAFCEGMNRLVIHGFPHNPTGTGLPGIGYFAGTHYNDKQIWWPFIKPFHDYLARISFIQQEAQFVADVLLYYGEDIPNLVPPKNTKFTAGPGFDYEVVNTEILMRDLTVEKGEWVIPGVGRYKTLCIGADKRLSNEVEKRLETLVSNGGTLHRKKTPPTLSIEPDFVYPDQNSGTLDFIHYQKQGLDFYIVRNTTDSWIDQKCTFRVQSNAVELWDPLSGKLSALKKREIGRSQTEVPLTFPPGSCFIVAFHPGSAETNNENINYLSPSFLASSESLDLSKGWMVNFDQNRGGPGTVTFDSLFSWTKHSVPGVRFYSGIAEYQKRFTLRKLGEGKEVVLDLGTIKEVASVSINDVEVGVLWAPPYRLNITEHIKVGPNTLKIKIGNTWSNRLTGDKILDQNFTQTNLSIAARGNPNKSWAEIPLITSGLLGPVNLYRLNNSKGK